MPFDAATARPEGFDPGTAVLFDPATAVLEPETPGVLERIDAFMRRPVTPRVLPSEMAYPMTGPEDPSGGMSEEQRAAVDPALRETTMRVGLPLAAMAAAPVSGGMSLPLVLAGGGALTGEILAQKSEHERGAREEMSVGRMVAAPVTAMVPLGPASRGAVFVRGELAAARPLAVAERGVFGAGVGAGGSAVEQAIDTGKLDWEELAKSAAWGAVFGAALGGAETAAATRAQKAALFQLRQRTGQWQMDDLEFMAWLRTQRQRAASPGRPAEEGATVSPDQIQPIPERYQGDEAPLAPVRPAPAAPAPETPAAIVPAPAPLPAPAAEAAPSFDPSTAVVAPPEEPKPTPGQEMKGIIAAAQKEAGWDPSWPFIPQDLGNKTFVEGLVADETIPGETKQRIFDAARKLGVSVAEPPAGAPKFDEPMKPAAAEPPAPESAGAGAPPPAALPKEAETAESFSMAPDPGAAPQSKGSPQSGHEQAVSQIIKAIEKSDFKFFGLRVLKDDAPIEIVGREAAASWRWEDGTQTEDRLAGPSAIEVRKKTVEEVRRALSLLGVGTNRGYDYYDGKRVVLLGANRRSFGEDLGEIVMPRAQVVGLWEKSGSEDVDIIPNPNTPRAEGGALQSASATDLAPETTPVELAGQEATVAADPAGNVVVAPEPAAERRVSQHVDRKQLRVQKEYLLEAAQRLAAAAPEEGGPATVTIEVPGDGTFTVPNNQAALARFATMVQARFGSPAPFTARPEANRAPAPRALPALKAKPTAADLSKAAGLAAADEPDTYRAAPGPGAKEQPNSRAVLNHVLGEDGFAIATNGRMLVLVGGGRGETRAAIKQRRAVDFPQWRQVLPKFLRVAEGKVSVGRTAPKQVLELDTAEALKVVGQIDAITDERRPPEVLVYDLGQGRAGYSTQAAGIGDYRSEGVEDGMAPVLSLNPEYLRAVLAAARGAGHGKVRAYVDADAHLATFVGGQNFAAVVMGMRLEGQRRAGELFGAAPAATAAAAPAAPAARAGRAKGAKASIGAVGERPAYGAEAAPELPPAPPPAGPSAPQLGDGSDDPGFSQLPLQLPEMVEFYKLIASGKVPKIVRRINVLHGMALGVFRAREGNLVDFSIELRADLFHLLSVQEKQALLEKAVAWASMMKQADPAVDLQATIREKFHQLVREAEAEALQRDPRRALETFAHEIGHYVDFLPEGTMRRGNILGRIASLKRFLQGFLAEYPAMVAAPPTAAERAALRRQAERELEAEVRKVVEVIRREEPVYETVGITPDMITSILKQAQREEFPELYDWFAKLDRAAKADVLRKAMKGIVDERAAAFSSRRQVGTRVVEETVTRQVGEVTPEAIRARYDELLRAELRRRGLVSLRDVRRELEGAIAWWNGTPTIPKYYTTPEEMYAETFSILLNNPAGLAKRAPTFWRLFHHYLERKPAVKRAYEQLQADIRSGAIHRQRVERLRAAWREDEESALLRDIAGARIEWGKVRDALRLLFDRQHGPIESRALRRLDSPQSQRVLAALKDYLYRMTAVEGYARALNLQVERLLADNNLRHDDLAEFMFHSRIAGGDRQELANAQGWSPNTSAERLQEMRGLLGAARFGALEEAQRRNRAIYEQHVVALLRRADVLAPELLKAIEERTLYATFAKTREFNPLEASTIEGLLAQTYGKDVTARIYRQIGYLGDVRSPYLALTQKAFSLIQFAYRQMALRAVRDYMVEHEPLLIAEAERRWNGRGWEPRIVDTPRVGTLLLVERGEVQAYYVPREWIEVLEHGSPLETMIVGLAHRVLSWPKALLTELNPGFWPVAFARDLATIGLQLPKGLKAFRHLPRAYRAARATLSGRADTVADAALRRLMVISRADPRGEHLGHPDEMTRLLLRLGQNPQLWDTEAARVSRAMRFWMAWKRQGMILERAAKIAGMLHLDSEEFATMPEWQKKRTVNELAGSPDFLERGRGASVVELFGGPIFYNAWLQGMRAFKRAAVGGGGVAANPREFWAKFLAFFGLPALAYYAFEKGYFDLGQSPEEAEAHREMLRSVPERDKLRGFVVPLGWVDRAQGKVAYLVLPFPDQVRMLHAGLRKAAQTAGGDDARGLGMGTVVQFGGQDLPGQNPIIAEGVKWWQYHALGQNPYDSFRGRPTLDPDVFAAGQGGLELAQQSLSNVTGGIAYRHRPTRPGDTKTPLEQFLDTPVISNLLGRWVRVSNAGLLEDAERITEPVARRHAELRLVGDEMARKMIAGEAWSPAEEKLSTLEPYLVEYLFTRMDALLQDATGPELRAWRHARSTEEKAALLQAWAKREEEKRLRLQR